MDNFDLKKYISEGFINLPFTSKDKLLQKEFTKKQWDEDWNPFIYDGKIIIDTKPGQDISDDYGLTLKRTDILDDLLKKYYESGKIKYDTYAEYYQFPSIHPAIFFTYDELVQWAKKGFKPQTNYPPTARCLLYGKGCPTNK